MIFTRNDILNILKLGVTFQSPFILILLNVWPFIYLFIFFFVNE